MIVILISLWSLCAIYFTHLFTQKKMKTASIAILVLFAYVIAWIYTVFIMDVADLGFSDAETGLTSIYASDVYHLFVNLTNKMSAISFELLIAIVVVACVVLMGAFAVAFHGLFVITKAVVKAARGKTIASYTGDIQRIAGYLLAFCAPREILRWHCRMNC